MLNEGSLRQKGAYYESINVNYQNRKNSSRRRKNKKTAVALRVGVNGFTGQEHEGTF